MYFLIPCKMHSFFNPAVSLRLGGISIRPVLSSSTSCAGAIMRRCNNRARLENGEAASISLSESCFHSSGGKSHRQRSIPDVITSVFPGTSERSLLGTSKRPLSSSAFRYCPVIIPQLPLSPIFSHFFPHSLYSRPPRGYVNLCRQNSCRNKRTEERTTIHSNSVRIKMSILYIF